MRPRHGLVAAALVIVAAVEVPAATPAEAATIPIRPMRVLDTRSGLGADIARVAPGAPLRLELPSAASAGATSVVLNLTADQADVDGFVTAWPCDASMPDTSILNFTPGHAVANMVALKLPPSGLCFATSAPTHLIGDLMGWFTRPADFQGTMPHRLLDTRQGGHGAPLPANAERRLRVAGTPGVAESAVVAALNVTVVDPAADGFVTVYRCGSVPEASTVNFRAGEVVPNFTFAEVTGGDVCFRASVGTHIVVDSFGWSTGTAGLRGLQPSRVLDTRNNTWSTGPAQHGQTLRLRVAGRGGVPNDASAALLTITADSVATNGFVSAWPCDDAMPDTSALNLWAGTVRSNLGLVKLSAADGEVCLRTTVYDGSSITLIADAVGWAPGGPARGPVPPGPTPQGDRFTTLPVGATLPGDAECAARVRPSPEVRPANAGPNATRGTSPNDKYPRVTGNFTGTTDEILQWAACKWGIDEDVVRAQIVKESFWNQSAIGDNGQSYGLGQVREPYHGSAFEDDNAIRSSAYNVDYTYAGWRSCFEGNETWLNTVERGREYTAGDLWGCVGVWFSGRWYTEWAIRYIEGGDTGDYGAIGVEQHLQRRTWEEESFINDG